MIEEVISDKVDISTLRSIATVIVWNMLGKFCFNVCICKTTNERVIDLVLII